MKTHWINSVNKTTHYSDKSHFLSQSITYLTGFFSQFSNIAIVAVGVYLAKRSANYMEWVAMIAFYDFKWKSNSPNSSASWNDY